MAISVEVDESSLYQLEMNSLLDVIYHHYGYDYRNYAKRSVLSRLLWRKEQWNLRHLSDLIPLVLHSESHFQVLLSDLSITVTEPFRDPDFYAALLEEVFPFLDTFPFFKIWHAGCATGEEVYSLAILLKEHELLDRAQIYATDINPAALKTAQKGIYPEHFLTKYQAQYVKAGGQNRLDSYFRRGYGNIIVDDNIRRRIIFSMHNLVMDQSFGVMELIICRNVMIYFNGTLKARVFRLFANSLYHTGYLCLGASELLNCDEHPEFSAVRRKAKIYRKAAEHSTSELLENVS